MERGRAVTYRNDHPHVPWSIHIVTVDRSRTDYELVTTLARGTIFGLSPISTQVKSIPPELGRPIAAVNGDFYQRESPTHNGDPMGLQILNGELVSGPNHSECFWIDTNGNPQIGRVVSQFKITWPKGEVTPFGLNEDLNKLPAVLNTPRLGSSTHIRSGRELILESQGDEPWLPLKIGQTYSARVREVRPNGDTRLNHDIMVLSLSPELLARIPRVEAGAVLKISTATSPDLKGVKTAIGGGPALVHNGQPVRADRQLQLEHRTALGRHPRSAIGWNKKFFFLVEVDGRQPDLSIGMSFPELGNYMAKLGCEEALNLDGGGSSTFWVDGHVVNSPCDGTERSVANALVVVRKETGQGR